MKDLLERVKTALISLGYNMDRHKYTVQVSPYTVNYVVLLDGEYFGMWDDNKRTFVD